MLNEDKQLKSEEVQKLVKQNLDKGESQHKKIGIKYIVFGARALVDVVLQSQIVN